MINGKIYLVKNMDQAAKLQQLGFNILYAGESANIPASFFRVPILLPPIEAVDAEVNGDMGRFAPMYENYLITNETVISTLCTIFVALHNGMNLGLFMEGEELAHVGFFREFMANAYGIIIGDEQIPFSYNPGYNSTIAAMIYTYQDGFINYYEMIGSLPDYNYNLILDGQFYNMLGVRNKLCYDLQVSPDNLLSKIAEIKNDQKRFTLKNGPSIIIGGMPDVSRLEQ